MPVLSAVDSPLHNVQHLLRLREEQRLVPLLPPVGQHLHTRHLSAAEILLLPEAHARNLQQTHRLLRCLHNAQ